MLFSELKNKEVIDIKDCKKLGKIQDLEFDPRTGCVRKFFVPCGSKCSFFFSPEPDYVLDFNEICQIGPDIILVDAR
ncbi:MAG: YlmC/YmxH family sporulation protein [Lachnospiraceae bacterium]|nr:YlmC/YmxH family sporulation protein [Lachnospiraceae bacterium]